MADDVSIRIRLQNAVRAAADARKVAGGVRGIGDAAGMAGRRASMLGPAIDRSAGAATRGIGKLVAAYGALQVGQKAAGGVLWGLKFNAQVEAAQQRFTLFTSSAAEARSVLKGVDDITINSAFSLGELSDAAANLGNAGLGPARIVPTLQGIANAAAASGKGAASLGTIADVLSQISASGKISAEDVNRLNIAGAPNVQKALQKGLGLTAEEVGNIGNEAVDGRKAVRALTAEWSSGKIAEAAARQTRTLGGQWQYLIGSLHHGAGELTEGLAKDLETTVLPAAQRAVSEIRKIFGTDGLSNEEKLRRAKAAVERELGPIARDLERSIGDMHLDRELGNAIRAAGPAILDAFGAVIPKALEAAFTAWLHSGPMGQLFALLYVGKKTGALKGIGKLAGGGRGGSPVGELLSKGGSPANPLYVFTVNDYGVPIGGKGGKTKGGKGWLSRTASKYGPAAGGAAAAGRFAVTRALPVAGAGVGGYEIGRHLIGPPIANLINGDGGGPAANPRSAGSAANVLRQQGAGPLGGLPLETQLIVKIGEREVERAVVRSRAKRKARG